MFKSNSSLLFWHTHCTLGLGSLAHGDQIFGICVSFCHTRCTRAFKVWLYENNYLGICLSFPYGCCTQPFIVEHLSLRRSQGITEFQITRLSCILAYTLYTGPFSSSTWRPNFWYMCLIFSYTLHTGFQGLAI